MITSIEIEHKLTIAIHYLRQKYSFNESFDCVLKLFLFKRLSDQSEAKVGQQMELFIPEELRWNVIKREQSDISKNLTQILSTIEKHNPSLDGVFTNLEIDFWTGFDDQTLKYLIQLFSELKLIDENLVSSNVLENAFDNFIEKKVSDGLHRGEIYTPHSLTRMIIELINPQEEMSIYNPTCGFGEFLTESVKFIRKNQKELVNLKVYGEEANLQRRAIAKINLIFHGISQPDIRLGDTLFKPSFIKNDKPELFDIILASPPFNIKYQPDDIKKIKYPARFPYGIPRSKADFLFVQHILSSLTNKGKAAIILPTGVLYNQTNERIRNNIIESDLIEAIIELPNKLFYQTSINVLVVIFNRNKNHKNKILFINARDGYEKIKTQNILNSNHIECIVSSYRNFKNKEGFSTIVSLQEIVKNEYNLNIDRYIMPPMSDKIDIDHEIAELHQLELERSELEKKIDNYLKVLGIRI